MLERIRKPQKRIPLNRAVIYSMGIMACGLITGVGVKLMDIYTVHLGNIFSQMSVWIFLCSALAVYSSTPRRAAVNVFLFCAGMLLTYYLTAEGMHSPYSMTFVYGWSVFSLFSPVLAFFTWYAKGKGTVSRLLTAGIVVVLLVLAVLLFDRIRISDLVFAVLTAVILIK
ncbi:MAG TPA: hypothetical protein IAA59_06135 [Candidatus Faecaligallichristensenella faecipullorum]|nr:hypothetical protein [Candidatus Faecaligallichristensenella faecipullorum]